jgi:hypothetical protein
MKQDYYKFHNLIETILAKYVWEQEKLKLFTFQECCILLDVYAIINPELKFFRGNGDFLLEHLAKSCRNIGWSPEDSYIDVIRDQKDLLNRLYKLYPEGE